MELAIFFLYEEYEKGNAVWPLLICPVIKRERSMAHAMLVMEALRI